MKDYRTLAPEDLRAYLAAQPSLAEKLGGSPSDWAIREVSDGNLNNVYLVSGSFGGVCCKQSLPHVRVDPSWRMPLDRAAFEARYLRCITPYVGHQIPKLLHYDDVLFLIVMESLTGYQVLRGALNEGIAQPGFSARIGEYLGHTAFHTSWLARRFEDVAPEMAAFSHNHALIRITVDLILTDPYRKGCSRNHWLAPELDDLVEALQSDKALHVAVGHLQERFLSAPEALLHGDLHTGSIMLRGDDVRVIDGEFALYGPVGFDAGLYIGNLLLHGLACPEHADWMRDEIIEFWRAYKTIYSEQRRAYLNHGDVQSLLDENTLPRELTRSFHGFMKDIAGFAGVEMIRRTIGYAQISDYDRCVDRPARADAMRDALQVGRSLILEARQIETVEGLLAML
ncbi:S-methyl-5-thioribose kinase [Kozakia baliensis]|uniref:S-methyl-5-thioribose kinase n=1 Tax=Kozakia baliensis TaxID=153496 RepID=A0A1D8UTE1_9PROT|nr:S-methyl-5-thioribose kinase [Kozakia baliensis]AOX16737.1 hypothetical protein A0U89_05890 [Kozakia baliensis]GBR31870.1 methylthioribose kinase [Kozakia baliensis NRIC 0488]GEL64717.1 methylthioribose kinase [Kozakia baliensis]